MPGNIECLKELVPGLVEVSGGVIIAGLQREKQAAKSFDVLDVLFEGGGANFINKGTNGRWKDVLSPEDIAKCDEVAARNLTPDCAHWLKTAELG